MATKSATRLEWLLSILNTICCRCFLLFTVN
uniref:Uncharacterized protein n=2 Tax=unclassified Caudoviricetes TaxID=2788787 RepID=A0A8S5PE32_9CAUD|nr:MAG TPA: hypothetical protein [Caudovirales sp. ctbaM10]DAE15778.1 MAG TPA: hypothetical protein [Caudovirales sp. ctIyl37]